MRTSLLVVVGILGTTGSILVAVPAPVHGQSAASVTRETRDAWTPPRTPWGDPDLQGAYTNSDESLTPLERPDKLAGRRLTDFTEADLAELRKERNDERVEADRQRWELRSPLHWFENHDPKNSRAWLVVDPPDGKVPAQVSEAAVRLAAREAARRGRGPADSYEDRSLYDRCITRGLPGSMMPAIYGNAYQIVQGPGYVALTYEMVHETRIVPLDGRPTLGSAIRQYMGDARGRWEGATLVVETTNFTDRTPYRGSSEHLQIVERFTRVAPDIVEWTVTLIDPHTWTRPWTFAMNLTRKDDTQQPFEYACHEGNLGLEFMLRAARAEEKKGLGALPKPLE